MPMTPELYQAVLAMDAYNRGYLPGLDLAAAGSSTAQPITVTVHSIDTPAHA